MEEPTREQSLADARAALDWLESHPDVPLPYEISYGHLGIFALNTKEEARTMARAMGSFDKAFDDDYVSLTKTFGSVKVRAVFNRRDVCERVVIGVEEIPETVIPERVEPARKVEKVEWRCASLLNPDEVAA